MSEIASAYVSLIPSLKGAKGTIGRELDGVAGSAGKSSGRRMGSGMAAGVAGMATKVFAPLAAAAATVSIGGFFKDAVSQASDLNESSTKLNAIFGKSAAQVQKFAAGGAKALGQTKLAVLDASATFGTFGKAAGLSGKDLAGFSTQFAGLSTDLASFYNTSPEQAVEAIGAALRGEAEPMRQYGVLLDDATMRQQALKMGLIKTTKQALTPQQKVLAAQAVIMKQTKDAQGDFARTSGGLANQQRILAAQWSDMKTNLGSKLLPVVTKFVTFLNNGMGPAFSKIGNVVGPAFKKVGDAFKYLFTDGADGAQSFAELMDNVFGNSGRLVAPLRIVGQTIKDVILGVRAMFLAFQNGDVTSNGLVGAFERIGATARALIPPIQAFVTGTLLPLLGQAASFIATRVVPAFMGIVTAVRGFIAVALPIVQAFVAGMMARIQPMLPTIRAIFGTIGQIVVGVMGLIQAIVQRVTAIVGGIWSRWGRNIMDFAAKAFGNVLTIIGGALKIIQGLIKTATAIFKGDWSGAWAGIKMIVSGAWQVIKGIVSQALHALSGIIRGGGTLLKAAMTWVGTKINEALTALKDKMLGIGGNIVDGLAQGIRNAAGRVAQAAHDLAMKIPEPIRKALNIHSPSKVTKQLGAWVGQGLAIGMTGTAKQVAAAAVKLAANISGPLERRVADEVRSLKRLAGQRESVAGRLKAAQRKLSDALKVRDDYAKSVRESFSSFGQITGIPTSGGMIDVLTERVRVAKEFRANLTKLQKLGLSKTAYKQIVDAGPEQGAAAARALVEGGVGDIRKVNSLLGQLQSAGNSVAATASKAMYQAGVDSARGLVKGLQSQSSALAAAAKKVADSLVRQVKKSLGIKSPSRVFAKEVGAHIPTGVIRGIDSTQGQLTARLSKMASPQRLGTAVNAAPGAGSSIGLSQSDINRLASAFAQVQLKTTVSAGSFDSAMAVGM